MFLKTGEKRFTAWDCQQKKVGLARLCDGRTLLDIALIAARKMGAAADGWEGFSVVRSVTQFSIAACCAKKHIGKNTSPNAKIYFKRASKSDHISMKLCGNPKALSDRAATY